MDVAHLFRGHLKLKIRLLLKSRIQMGNAIVGRRMLAVGVFHSERKKAINLNSLNVYVAVLVGLEKIRNFASDKKRITRIQ